MHYATDPKINEDGWISTDARWTLGGSGVATFEIIVRSTTAKLFFYFDAPDGLFVHREYYGESETRSCSLSMFTWAIANSTQSTVSQQAT